jgi:hypothetical protein
MQQATWEPDEEGQMKGFIDEFNKAAILEHHDVTTVSQFAILHWLVY